MQFKRRPSNKDRITADVAKINWKFYTISRFFLNTEGFDLLCFT